MPYDWSNVEFSALKCEKAGTNRYHSGLLRVMHALFWQCLVSYLADLPGHSAPRYDGPETALVMRWSVLLRRLKRETEEAEEA